MLYIKEIPTRESNGEWTYTTFDSLELFAAFLKSIFKKPGKYNLDKNVPFNEHSKFFNAKGMFTTAPKMSRDYFEFWDTEREKCRKGVIFKGPNGQVWYLTRYYYHWLNFLQIGGKESGKFQFPNIWDTQYHMCLYDVLAEANHKNNVTLKKRQIAWSYIRQSKMYNKYIFEEAYVGKLLASNKKYIDNTNGSWKMFNEYQNFTNKHTAWACANTPDKEFSWQQKVEVRTDDGRKIEIGTQAVLVGITLDKDPVGGVGGRVSEANYEEGGIAPTADVTYGYMLPAMKQGDIITGMFTIGGSVGALDQCGPLKNWILNPEGSDFYGVETDLIDDKGTVGIRGLFIPEQWSFPPYIDEHGNSLVEEALAFLNEKYAKAQRDSDPSVYQLLVSQGPRNIREAFALRTASMFPAQHTISQIEKIDNGDYPVEYVDLIRNTKNEIEVLKSDRLPINEFPLPMKTVDKKGIVCIHERPIKDNKHGTYIATVDPVETGKSTTSFSLASIIVYKLDIEVVTEEIIIRKNGKEGFKDVKDEWGPIKMKTEPQMKDVKVTQHLEGGKIVAFWCGRFDDPDETNEYMSRLAEFYNARVMSENNKPSFINYMRSKRRHKYLALKSEILFDKDLNIIQNNNQPYGVGMTAKLKEILTSIAVDSLSEVLFEERDKDGEVTKVHYGVERITDKMLLVEMQEYHDKLNVDRLICYIILMGWLKSIQAANLIRKKIERTIDHTESKKDEIRFKRNGDQLFQNMGRGNNSQIQRLSRSPFRHIK